MAGARRRQHVQPARCRRLAERERVGADPGIKERDLERAPGDRAALPDELVQALPGRRSVAVLVDVDPVRGTWRLAVDEDAEPRRGSLRFGSHDEMKITGVKTARDRAAGRVQHGGLFVYGPVSLQGPVTPRQQRGGVIELALAGHQAPGETRSSRCAR